jgi:hypothetical protein
MSEETGRARPTEIARELVEGAQRGAAAALSTVVLPGGFKWALATQIADAIRRERVVIFRLRDAASAAASELSESYERLAAPLRAAVEFSLTAEDLDLPQFNAPHFEHMPSARIACLDVRELTPGRLTFEFEDNYTGKGFVLTFDAKSEILCGSRLEGASADQLGAMIRFALEDLALRREKGDAQ